MDYMAICRKGAAIIFDFRKSRLSIIERSKFRSNINGRYNKKVCLTWIIL